jgi:enoyl-[acyl-carrier protein] reductase I
MSMIQIKCRLLSVGASGVTMGTFSLAGKKGLVIGIANEHSVAWGCARVFRRQGAELAVTFLNDKAEPHVRRLAQEIDAPIFSALDVTREETVDRVFAEIESTWGSLDFLLHSIAFCPKQDLHAPVVETSRDGFLTAMDISCHSFLRIVNRAVPLMKDGGTCMTVSFLGAERAVEHYNIMGPVKAALESSVKYAAVQLGPKKITVHALSPGPLNTRAASGIAHFDEMLQMVAERTPGHRLAEIDDVGAFAAFLASDAARNLTGGIHYIDGGFNVVA